MALNAYVEENSTEDAELAYWQPVSGGYPSFADDFTSYAATTPDTPTVTYTLGETSGTDTSVTYEAGSEDTLVLTAGSVTCEDNETILYQWYSSTSDSVSTAAEISGATGATYTVDTSASGTTYYWVSAAIQNPYTRTVEVFSAAFTVAVEFTIDDDGSINGGTFVISLKNSEDSTNSEDNPYVIDTAEKLMALPAFLNAKSDAYYFEQTADIDLESAAWSPIGPSTTYPFKGVYDGGGYTVKGLYINAAPTANYGYGMFGYVSGGTVKNLTVSGEITITTLKSYVGGIVGYAAAGSTIDGCATEDMTVSGGLYTGGIVGDAVKDSSSAPTKITNCTNGADVINSAAATGYAGGILGYSVITSYGAISNLTNNGSVTTDNKATAGGIIGYQANGGTAAIENVVNNGAITSSGSYAGGLIGYDYASGSITNGVNTGTIYCENSAGGLVGYNRSSAKILNSANTGAVSGGKYVGGLVGYGSAASSVLNSSNTGEIDGGTYVGGLAGYISGNVKFYNSYNTGTVTGEFVSSTDGTASYATYVGGLVGYMSGSAYNCYNSAAVTGGSDAQVGALLGYLLGSRTISSSYYLAQDDDIEAVAEPADGSTVEYLGSFDTAGTLTAADEESGLAYTGDLLNQLNAWVIDNLSEYEAYGWIAQDDGYPILSSDVDLSGSAPAAVTVEMSEENPSKVALNSSGVELTANIKFADGIVGTVTYQWLADDEVVSSGTFETTAETTALTSSVAVPTDTYGLFTYTLEVKNTNPDYAVYQSGSAETTIVVNKPEGETKWYGSWDVADGFAEGTGTEDDPYLISEANQLALLAQYVNAADSDYAGAYYKVTTDIDLNNEQWTRIGSTNSFTGYFDGDGHSIAGLYFSGSNSSVGLFGYISGAMIENLSVTGSVEGTYAVTVLAGKADGTNVIQNVLTYGSVTGTAGTSDIANGTAGIVGFINKGSLTMTNCGNEADVTVTAGSTKYNYTGGLVGLFYGPSSKTLTIDSCYNAGTISANGSSSYALGGGLIGGMEYGLLTLTNSYNIGTVAGTGTSAGLMGGLYMSSRITAGSTIENCYNAGTLAGTGSNYSLLGYNMASTSSNYTVTNCYYLSTVCADVTDKGYYGTEVNTLSTSLLNGDSGSAFKDASAVGTVKFVTDHTSVTLTDSSEAITSAEACAYPYLSWQSGSPDSCGYVAFQVSLTDSSYTLADVTASGGNVVTVDADNYVFVAAVTGDDTVTVRDVPAVNLTVTGENATLTFVSGYVSATETDGQYTVGQNTTVTFTVKADSGYAVTSVSAAASGEEQILTADDNGVYTLQIGTEGVTLSFVTQPTYEFYYTLTNAAKPEILSGSATFGGTTAKPTLTLINGDTVTFSVAPNSGYVLTPASVAFTVTKTDEETSEDYEYTAQTLKADDNGVYSLTVSEILADGETALVDSTMKITATAASVAVDSAADLTFTGSEIEPDVTVTVDGDVLSADCYTLSYSDNIDVGTATVTATMKNGYVGTLTGTFSIEAKELTENDFTVPETADYNYGSAVEVAIVSDFEADVDYTVSYDNNINAGTATLTITGIGNYTGTLTYEFQIVTAELDGETVTISFDEAIYTGEDVKPAVKVTLGESELTENTDYTVAYGDETTDFVNAGSVVTVVVTFTGNYSGTATATYTIAKADQTLTVNYDTQELPVSANKDLSTLNLVSGNQTELVYGLADGDGFTLDGSVLTMPETAGATATVTIYAAASDNYNASEPVAVTVTTVNKAEVSVTFENGSATYTGEALTYETAVVEVEETGATWTYVYFSEDGTMLDSAPTDAGTYTVTVTYTSDDSTGTASATFIIEPQTVEAAVALADSSAVYTYTGNAIEPDVTITVGETVLTEDTVYTYEVSCADNVNAGTATVTVTFTGNYTGSASAEFTIAQRTLSAEDFALESDSVVYNGSAQTPVTPADGLNLTEGTDYSIEYANNTDVGTATVIITGIAPNCTSSVELTFEITGSDVSENVTVTVADENCVYTGEAIEPTVTVTMGEETLTADAYTVEYANNVNAGTATVTVTLTGNYSGTVVTENFTIEKAEQTLVMKDGGTIIAEIGETLDLATLIDESSSYVSTSVLMFTAPTGFSVTHWTTLSVTQAVEAGTEIELTVYALGTDNYNASETVTFTVTAVERTSITIDSGNAKVAVYERTTETNEDGEVQTVDTPLSADETSAYSAKQGMTISFTVTPANGYGVPTVTVNGETVEPDEDGYYVVELTAELLAEDNNLVISVSAKRTSWDETGDDTADADIESIIASDAADTQSKDADGSTYKDYLDYNDDGKNDLLDILQILYRTENTDSTDETVEEAASEETTEDAAEASDESSEEAAADSDAAEDSDADSDESSEETAE